MNRTWLPSQAGTDTDASLRYSINSSAACSERLKPQVTSVTAQGKPGKADTAVRVKTDTLSFRNMHEYGELLSRFLEARKTIFLDRYNWHVSEADGMEFDQYDTPAARWVILHRFGEILGGVRMLPTTAKCGIYSYMLRDAQCGILEGLPSDILYIPAPVEHNVWEASRFFITDAVAAADRQKIQVLLFQGMSRTAMDNGGTHILGVVPAIWSRWARRIGVKATPIGSKFSIEGMNCQSVLFEARDFLL